MSGHARTLFPFRPGRPGICERACATRVSIGQAEGKRAGMEKPCGWNRVIRGAHRAETPSASPYACRNHWEAVCRHAGMLSQLWSRIRSNIICEFARHASRISPSLAKRGRREISADGVSSFRTSLVIPALKKLPDCSALRLTLDWGLGDRARAQMAHGENYLRPLNASIPR